jgi:hypothetical protein
MTAWSIAPWLIALVVAAGLGAFGRFSDTRSRHRQDSGDDLDRETADRSYRSSEDD